MIINNKGCEAGPYDMYKYHDDAHLPCKLWAKDFFYEIIGWFSLECHGADRKWGRHLFLQLCDWWVYDSVGAGQSEQETIMKGSGWAFAWVPRKSFLAFEAFWGFLNLTRQLIAQDSM